LYRRLVVEQKLATSAGSGYDPDSVDLSVFSVYATAQSGGDSAVLEPAVDAEIARLVADGVTADEVARAKALLQAEAVKSRDSLAGPARSIGAALATGSTVEEVESWPERIGAVTIEQVNAAARAVFKLDDSVTGRLLPAAGS
ncbi:MAG: M16 family metallopeptidase, partial [Dongiaceae bacterium]